MCGNAQMIKSLTKLLFGAGGENLGVGQHEAKTLQHAAAGLLTEAAMLDGHFHETERERIRELLTNRFDLSADDVIFLIESAEEATADRVELHTITRTLCDNFNMDERIKMIEMLWEVIYADGKLDDFESNMMRRVSGLLYVSDRESGKARKRVLAKAKPMISV